MKILTFIRILPLILVTQVQADGSTLHAAFERAWGRHPQAVSHDAREAEVAARDARARGLTPAPASLAVGHLNDAIASNRGKREWEVELATPLWLPGQKAARQAEADLTRAAMAARRAVLRLQLAGEVREAWWNLARARNALALAQRRVEDAKTLEATVDRRYRAGDLARMDANLARSERIGAEADLANTQSAELEASQAWQRLTGLPVPAVLPAETAAAGVAPETHPEQMSAEAVVQVARSQLRVTEVESRDAPALALRMVRDRDNAAANYGHAVGIRLTVPFSQPVAMRQDQAAARASLAEAEADLALLRERIRLAQAAARATRDRIEQQMPSARERLVLAEDNRRLAEKSFALGESDLAALLRARAAAFEAASLENRLEVARAAAQSGLNQSLGVLP